MFEDSTFESTGRIRTRSRRWMMAALLFNGSLLTALILIPLIYPEALPRQMISILMEAPVPPAPSLKPMVRTVKGSFHGAPEMDGRTLIAPGRIRPDPAKFDGPEGAAPTSYIAMDNEPEGEINISNAFRGHGVTVAPPIPKEPVRVSSSVVAGLLLDKVLPVYPVIAKVTHKEGAVVLQATISARGTVEDLRVVSGDPILRQAALDAVSHWRYRPYLLNGQPVEVETTMNVIFKLNE
jgi:periplasmic protein TonB